jgi:RecD/TraA family predicted helicase
MKLEITKVILTRGEDWALVEFRTTETKGTCGGNFGCSNSQIVPGQIYKGNMTMKRMRSGGRKCSFKGAPVSRVTHALKAAFKAQGIGYKDRSAIFMAMKPTTSLINALEKKRSAELMNIPKVGRKKLLRMYTAYDSVATELNASTQMSQRLPGLHAYMNENQTAAAIKWKGSLENFTHFIQQDPWRILYDTEYDGFGYENTKRSDFLAATKLKSRTKMVESICKDLNLQSNDPRAHRCKAIHTIRQYMKNSGNYWMPLRSFLCQMDTESSEPTWPIVIHENFVALVRYADIESFLKKTFDIIRAKYRQVDFTIPATDVQLDDTQRQAVIEACQSPLFILQGGAGTGKTTVCKHIAKSLGNRVVCAAPTGKAAQRLAEVTGVQSYTVHRLFYMSGEQDLPKTLLLDEQSMQEPEILAMLLNKRPFNKIIFVGDTAQLTSVGPGQFMQDICQSDIPKIELTKIYRSSEHSFIATNGQKIRQGITELDYSEQSFVKQSYQNDEQIIQQVQGMYDAQRGDMPMVLCNTNAEVAKLNGKLRQICNPIGTTPYSDPVNMDYSNKTWRYQDWRFGVGDSVINITNKYIDILDRSGNPIGKELQVANGEIGIVKRAQGPNVVVHFGSDVLFNIVEEDYLRPAYALTVNKSQGSEYPIVIYKSTSSWGDKRERLYTAITRAKQKCIIYEVGSAVTDCIRAKPARRKTFLMKR